jgi:hypothetical protein
MKATIINYKGIEIMVINSPGWVNGVTYRFTLNGVIYIMGYLKDAKKRIRKG